MYKLLTQNHDLEFKSVDGWRIGKTSIIKTGSARFYQQLEILNDIERCYNLVTGAIKESDWSMRPQLTSLESHYFDVKFYKNGNLHITHKNAEALELFNIRVGRFFNWIK